MLLVGPVRCQAIGCAAMADPSGDDVVVGESRWPMACAVFVSMVLTIVMPDTVRPAANWAYPALEGVLLVVLIVGDPGKIDRRANWLRTVSIVLVAVLVSGALWATGELVYDLVHGGGATNSASALLESGAIVWLSNNIAFSLLYWELDSGGPAVRAHGLPPYPDLAFPQHMAPELAPAGWRPQFIDYLYLGF